MTTIAYSPVNIQTSAQSVPSIPAWFGEVALIVQYLRKHEILSVITERVRFARRRFGQYEVIDFLAVLFGYAISGEPTLEAFYERLHPFAQAFMALFGRERLPARATLSRFLVALNQAAVESLRTLFLKDLLARPLGKEELSGGLFDRQGITTSSSMSMGRARQPANAPYRRQRIGLLHSGVYVRCAPPVTRGASAGKSCARAPQSYRPIRISFSARLEIPAMGNTELNCVGLSRSFKTTERPITTPKNAFCFTWMDNTEQGRSLLI